MSKFRIVPLLALTTILVIPATSLGDTYKVKATGSAGSYEWSPDSRHAPKGSKIVWRNKSDAAHELAAYGGNWSFSKDLPKGDKISKKFKKVGTFKYRCTVPGHSSLAGSECNGMCGEILVHN